MRRFISYPSRMAENPCVRLLNEKLEYFGWKEEPDINLWLAPLQAVRSRRHIQVIHFHWPETFWRTRNLLLGWLKCLVFILHVKYWQALGYTISFSCHNVLPHFGKTNDFLEKAMRRFILKHFDVVIGHSMNARNDLRAVFGIEPKYYALACHGLYENFLPLPANQVLDISEARLLRLYLACSQHRYKGTGRFVSSYCSLPTELLRRFELVLSGVLAESERNMLVANDVQFTYIPGSGSGRGFLSDEDLRAALSTVDFVMLPYEEITTSGAYFLALTFMKGVVASNLAFFRLHSYPETCLLYDSNDVRSLESVLRKLANNWNADHEKLLELRGKFSWSAAAEVVAHAWRRNTID